MRRRGPPPLRIPVHSNKVIERLRLLEIDIEELCARLEREGVKKFVDSYEKLLSAVDRRLLGESAA